MQRFLGEGLMWLRVGGGRDRAVGKGGGGEAYIELNINPRGGSERCLHCTIEAAENMFSQTRCYIFLQIRAYKECYVCTAYEYSTKY
jgi:hypothetical protein